MSDKIGSIIPICNQFLPLIPKMLIISISSMLSIKLKFTSEADPTEKPRTLLLPLIYHTASLRRVNLFPPLNTG